MKKTVFLPFLLIGSLVFTASKCKEDPIVSEPEKSYLNISVNLYNGNTPMVWDENVSIATVNAYKMELMKFYLCNIYAIKTAGTEQKLAEVLLADASKTDGMSFTFEIDPGNYDKVRIGFGLDSLLNASDPVQFAPGEPLSAAEAMYWSWATKYRFVRIDAKANENDTLGSPTDLLLAYHPGADEFYASQEFIHPFEIVEGDTTTIAFKLDMAAVFDGPGGTIDIPTEPQTHTEPSDYHIAVKFIDNWLKAFTVM